MSDYREALQRLNDRQRQAVETIDGPVLVIAGPGTGKTQLLTTRIAHILATTDTLPQNILCLTFTDSAALTMRERLANMIGQAAYDVTISTYHAFGSDLIRRFPDYFLEDSELQPADDLAIDRIMRGIVAGLPFSNPLKYSDAYLNDIKTLVSDAKRALLSPDNLRTVAKANLQFIEQFSPTVGDVLQGMSRVDKKSIPLFEQLLEAVQNVRQRESDPKRSQRVDPARPKGSAGDSLRVSAPSGVRFGLPEQFTETLAVALEDVQASGKTNALTAWKNNWLAKDADGRFVVDGARTNQKLLAAADVYQQYLQELQARGLFDYDDMILRAVRALETNNDLRFTLQEQYLYILLDEFQDTNGAQLRLVQLLTDNPVNEGRPNILAVGDDDQAIYAFQGADYSHMLQFKEMYRDVLPVPLTDNYRSHAAILGLARGIAEQIEERLHHHFPAIEKTLAAKAKDLPKQIVIERREAQSDVMQFAWVTQRIKQLIKDGMPPEEIAVLAPKHKHLEPLVPFLQQADIPVRYEKRENVLDDPAITQLLRMAELCLALANRDRGAADALWAEVLSFEFWNLPTSQIWQLSWQTSDEDQPWTDRLLADPQLKTIALFFVRLSQLAASETVETMLDYLIGSQTLDLQEPGAGTYTSPYYHHYFDGAQPNATTADFWNVLTNLIVLRARLREYRKEGDELLLLADLVEFVAAHRAAELKILNTSPYASATAAVQLMTAFKAKGMEFSTVFVLAVNDEAWGGKSSNLGSRLPLPPNLQYMRYAGATNDERLRLFYVALTRAKSQLYLVDYTQTYAGKGMTRLKYLNETTEPDGTVQSPLLPEGSQVVLPAEDGTPQPTTELAAYWQRRHHAALSQDDLRTLLLARLEQFQLSPTHVGDFTNLIDAGPQHFFLKTVLRFPQAPRAVVQFGNSMHETLEWIHKQTKQSGTLPTKAAVLKAFAGRLHAKRLSNEQTAQFLERGTTALNAYLAQRSQTISADNVVEYSFRSEGVFVGKAHLAGKIDKLIIDKQAKTIVIVDYKTGRSHSRWVRDIQLHKYRQQLYIYKMLVEGSHTFAGYTVTDAYLEFVEPDDDGVIQELHVQFDSTEETRLKRLIQAVWRHIKALDMPDTTGYQPNIGGVEAFEADLVAED